MPEKIETTPVEYWPTNWIVPVSYDEIASILYIREDYKKCIDKQQPLTYMWVIWALGLHKYVQDYGVGYSKKNAVFPSRREDRFAFAYMFSNLKHDHKLLNLSIITNNDEALNTLMKTYPDIKYYFDNCGFIIKWEPR